MTNKAEKIKEEIKQVSAIFGLFKQDASVRGKEVQRKREGEKRERNREKKGKSRRKGGKRCDKKREK